MADRLRGQDAALLADLLRRLLHDTPGGRALAARYGRPPTTRGR